MVTITVNPNLDGSVEYPSVVTPTAPTSGAKVFANSADSDKPYAITAGGTFILSSDTGPVLSGSGAPSTTPTYLFQRYVDTTAGTAYIATGTASSADWKAATT
jgi:hypothetical protein